MKSINLVYEQVEGDHGPIIRIHAQAGDKTSDILASRPVQNDETEEEAVVKTVEFLFAEPDTWDELQALEQEFHRHTHGGPE